ncbi:hypothetical protein AAC978_07735 [Desulfitobacterium sp. THU1]
MWINIDKPTKKVTLHEKHCSFVPTTDSKYKKINNMGRDGGWKEFKNREEALRFYGDNFPEFKRGFCYSCGTEEPPKNEVKLYYDDISEKELEELRKYDSNTPWSMRSKD